MVSSRWNRQADGNSRCETGRTGRPKRLPVLVGLGLLVLAGVPLLAPVSVQAAGFWHDPDLAEPGTDPFGDPFSGEAAPGVERDDVPPDGLRGEWTGEGPGTYGGGLGTARQRPAAHHGGASHVGDDRRPGGTGHHDDAGAPPSRTRPWRGAPPLFWQPGPRADGARVPAPEGRSWGCRPAAAMQTRLKIDNDLATGKDKDYGYSSGVMLEVAARTSAHDGWGQDGEPGLLCPLWRWLGGGRVPSEYVSFRLDQAIYTPENSRATWLIPSDRPYAATLMASLAGVRLHEGQWVRNELRLGWVGPSVRGEKLQNAVHRVIDAPRFRGWAHQLHDEPLLEWAQYRVRRWQPASGRTDVLGHWGMRLGNLQSSAFAGLEWRFGNHLQDDGGSAPLRPGSNEPGEVSWHRSDTMQWNLFVQGGVRAVAWDLTLDGNAWHDSHHVKRKPVVADAGAGFTVRQGRWGVQFMWVVRSREFRGQRHVPSFGSLQIGYSF